MTKANEPAYPVIFPADGEPYEPGLSKREKLAMEIYVNTVNLSGIGIVDEKSLKSKADNALRAADIFFEQLERK